MKNNIENIVQNGLCSSCGICVANCPVECIKMIREKNEYYPRIAKEKCINCGICSEVCSKGQACNYDGEMEIEKYLLGEYRGLYSAQCYDDEILNNATSGGVVTGMIKKLLAEGHYDCAFLVEGYEYQELIHTKKVTQKDDLLNTSKSRYLTVSHENTVRYMKANPKERIIIVGTGCVIQGILNTINKWKLDRENYLLIGLFCDKTMHYGVVDFFAQHPVGRGRTLKELYFRTKAAGGWPGGVRLVYTDGTYEDISKQERMRIKEYFMPECCLYCLDKLNKNCDISVGDNYVKKNSDKKGISSVIVRTLLGEKAWFESEDCFAKREETEQELMQSQSLKRKQQNYYYACIKGISKQRENTIPCEIKKEYSNAMKKNRLGKEINSYSLVTSEVKRDRLKSIVKKMLGFPKYIIKKMS